jgi:hypothetical protein
MRPLLSAAAALALLAQPPSSPRFVHHSIETNIPHTKNQTSGYGTPVLADFDHDGDLDFAVSTRAETLWWFENQNKGAAWVRHEASPAPVGQLGSAPLDVDRDGHVDIVIGGFWYRNSGAPKTKPFTRVSYDSRVTAEIHDVAVADIDSDGRPDIVAQGDKDGLFWYSIPANPSSGENWPRTTVTLAVVDSADDIHGGIAPRGYGDLDSDGDIDLVLPDRWLENRNKGQQWVEHHLAGWTRGPWGLSSRSWVADVNGDRLPDIVQSACDQKDSQIRIFFNKGAGRFESLPLPRTAPGIRGSFHSLAVADFDLDNDLDIITADQEDPSILPQGAAPRFYLLENIDGKAARWREHMILDSKLGGHDIQVGDVDGDGDPDIASKVWRPWPGSANSGRFHADWLENRAGR